MHQGRMAVLSMLLIAQNVVATETQNITPEKIEMITVTSTRLERDIKDVPESISVIGIERIDQARMFNIADVLAGTPGINITSKSGGYDTRLIIRGGGLKANYGIREIFLMRDEVPITDPDSFSKLDYIDTQDIERIEITKGPGNIYATGSTAGVVHIISRSVYQESNNYLGVAGGDGDTENYSLRLAGQSDAGDRGYALTASHRKDDNDWRAHNRFESSHISFKLGQRWTNDRELHFELGYSDADLDLPGDITEEQFEDYLHNGKQTDSNSQFKHRGRYSQSIMANAKYRSPLNENWQLKSRLYYTHWKQFHPVVPLITTAPGVDSIGTDLEFSRSQSFGSLVAGVTYRTEDNSGNKKYEYGDVTSIPSGRIISTNSNTKGQLAEYSDSKSIASGLFAQQSINSFKNWIIDLSMRCDHISIDQNIERYRDFNWSRGTYQDVTGTDAHQRLKQSFSLFSTRFGVNYSIDSRWSVFANLASGEQVPFASELEDNPSLTESKVNSFEWGMKGRNTRWDLDLSAYSMTTTDEIISILDSNGQTEFQNAGKTDKLGFEMAGNYNLINSSSFGSLWAGINYTYSDYEFEDFQEIVTSYGPSGPTSSEVDRSGNQLPFLPNHYYSLNFSYRHLNGLSIRLQSDTWDEYYVDNANSEKYKGYEWLTSLNINYAFMEHHKISFNIANISDKRYASVVKKDVGSDKAYTPGAPQSWLLSYRYRF